jgi:hypothetical protein
MIVFAFRTYEVSTYEPCPDTSKIATYQSSASSGRKMQQTKLTTAQITTKNAIIKLTVA